VFIKVTLPDSEKPVGGLGIQTWQKVGNDHYLVDELDPVAVDTKYF
jgi:hypothetical protein